MLAVFFAKEFLILKIYNENFIGMTVLFKWHLLADFIHFVANILSFKFLAKKQINYFVFTQLFGLVFYYFVGQLLMVSFGVEGIVMGLFFSKIVYLLAVILILRHDLFGKNRPI